MIYQPKKISTEERDNAIDALHLSERALTKNQRAVRRLRNLMYRDLDRKDR